jgi:ABC-type branched-subunit amino acid transport system substrate-binding protein
MGVVMLATLLAGAAVAQKKYDLGASDTEIKIGQTMPYSGPASAYGTIGKSILAYFQMVNDRGGINGRKIKIISEDDGYSPPKTVEHTRKLIEQDEVLFIFQSLGTPTNTAIQKYLNNKKVPHLFVATGATKWGDPQHFPWTMGWQPSYKTESVMYAQYLLKNKPAAKVAVLYQNDDYGKDYLHWFKDALGAQAAKMIVAEVSYEVTDPTVDSQIIKLKDSRADVFFNISTPKFAAQAIRKSYDIGWRPLHLLNSVSSSVGAVLKPAGFDKAIGIISAIFVRDSMDPQVQRSKEYADWLAFMKKYMPNADVADTLNVYAYSAAQTLEIVLRNCGDDLTRANVMKQAANLRGIQLPMLQPGITLDTGPNDFFPIEKMYLSRFNGKAWSLLTDLKFQQ